MSRYLLIVRILNLTFTIILTGPLGLDEEVLPRHRHQVPQCEEKKHDGRHPP